MPLPPNSKLGPYEIKSALGVGGMGEVYRARDARLNRDVAIKVLRQDSVSGSSGASNDLRSRFEREARAVAALNHPNIVAVFDFGIENSQQYIVSELIEGESLRGLLRGRPVPVRKLVDIATQVADGLAAAHTAGVVHRDLKPENIMLAKDGRVKILDFGLARQAPTKRPALSPGDPDETVLPDAEETRNLTSQGAVLGTANYMSPEQALGHELDYRSDQFSFGLILYELAAGKQAFARASSVETMAAIVREEPPSMDEKLPPPLKWIIDRCLHKEPEQRYESTRDLYRELKNLRDHFSEAYTSESYAAVTGTRAKPRWWKIPAICTACALIAAFLVYVLKPPSQDIGNYRYTPFASDAGRGVWSPDGKAVAYAGKVNGTYQTFLRYLDSAVAVQLTHEPQPTRPIGWSSDQNHIVVSERPDGDFSSGRIYSVATVGGEAEFIMDAACLACDVSKNGRAFATFIQGTDKLWSVEISDPIGSPLVPYANAPFASKDFYNPPVIHFSPDGKSILLLRNGDHNKRESWLLPYPAGKQPPRLVLPALAPVDIPPSFSWMADNRHIVVAVSDEGRYAFRHLWIADIPSNELKPLTKGTADEIFPTVSPDGRSMLFTQAGQKTKILSVSVLDGSVKTLIDLGRVDTMAAWAAKQEKLVWVTDRRGAWEVWLRSPDGSERPIVTAADFPGSPTRLFLTPSLSPNGDRLIFTRTDGAGGLHLWISSLSGGAPVRLTNSESSVEFGGAWSPDGNQFVYLQSAHGKKLLTIARTTGGAPPVVLRETNQRDDRNMGLSDWSPSGEWITIFDGMNWSLISPDGKTSKSLGKIDTPYLVFSRDGRDLYGIETKETGNGQRTTSLFSLDVENLQRRTIKELDSELKPTSNIDPGIRFSMAPDGKSFVSTTFKPQQDIWMLTGYRQPGLWNQIKDTLHLDPTK